MGSSLVKALIDTNVLIDHTMGVPEASAELDRHNRIAISRIVWIEFLVGAKTPEIETRRRSLLNEFELLEVDHAVAAEAVRIRRSTRLRLADSIILATARVHGLLLVTRNHRDFSADDPDIRIPY